MAANKEKRGSKQGRARPRARLLAQPDEVLSVDLAAGPDPFEVRELNESPKPVTEITIVDARTLKAWELQVEDADKERAFKLKQLKLEQQFKLDVQRELGLMRAQTLNFVWKLLVFLLGAVSFGAYIVYAFGYGTPAEKSAALQVLIGVAGTLTGGGGTLLLGRSARRKSEKNALDDGHHDGQ